MLDPWSWRQMKTNVEIRKELKASVFEALFLKVRVYQGLRWPPYHPEVTLPTREGVRERHDASISHENATLSFVLLGND